MDQNTLTSQSENSQIPLKPINNNIRRVILNSKKQSREENIEQLQIVMSKMRQKIKNQFQWSNNQIIDQQLLQVISKFERFDNILNDPQKQRHNLNRSIISSQLQKKNNTQATIDSNQFSLRCEWKRQSRVKNYGDKAKFNPSVSFQSEAQRPNTQQFFRPYTKVKENDISDLWRYKKNQKDFLGKFMQELDLSQKFYEIKNMLKIYPYRAQTTESKQRKVCFTPLNVTHDSN